MLVERGLVERRIDPVDRRVRTLFLTGLGREAVRHLRGLLVKAEADLLADLDDEEIAVMLRAFEKIEGRIAPRKE
jgi:MarR family transcriptional regulator for hemolysin